LSESRLRLSDDEFGDTFLLQLDDSSLLLFNRASPTPLVLLLLLPPPPPTLLDVEDADESILSMLYEHLLNLAMGNGVLVVMVVVVKSFADSTFRCKIVDDARLFDLLVSFKIFELK
jgi:hypothetical protein